MFISSQRAVHFLSGSLLIAAMNPAFSQLSVQPFGMDETIRASSAIFIGRVTDVRSRWGTPAHRWIATDFTFFIEDAIVPNGQIQKGRTAILTYAGGTIDGETQGIAGQVVPVKGQRYAMMLSADFAKPGHDPEAGGSGQGLFKIDQQKKGGPYVVMDANGAPLLRLSNGRVIRPSEAKENDRNSSTVAVEQFSQWVRQTAARTRPKPGAQGHRA